jgi:hypothetical protein
LSKGRPDHFPKGYSGLLEAAIDGARDEGVEAGLLLEHVRRGGLRRFAFEREMHAFMTAVVLRMAGSI